MIINPFDFFDAIYCINLNRRTDRWESVKKELEKIDIISRVIRFSAIETPENGHIGCMLSHRAIIKEACSKGYKNILVFEDDFIISNLNRLISALNKFFLKNYKYDIAYLGCNFFLKDFPFAKKITSDLYSIKGARSTHAIIYNKTIYKNILTEFPEDYESAIKKIKKYDAFDKYISLYLRDRKIFLIGKNYINQKFDFSDIKNRKTNIKYFLRRFINYAYLINK